jgi:hypothetical protein
MKIVCRAEKFTTGGAVGLIVDEIDGYPRDALTPQHVVQYIPKRFYFSVFEIHEIPQISR